ncbi:MAG: acetylornithine/succinylornithine family transaminase [Chloroflexota bacterium]|jgi:acetylornithine/LysW-gamma-L-lysine aminotransferase
MSGIVLDLAAVEQAHTSGAYVKRDVQIVRGEGARLWDADGRSYIDCVGGQGAANLGHAHPAVIAAISRQAADLIVCPELFHNPVRARYQADLCSAAQMPRVFLCNSGTEAIEGAIKIAQITTGRSGFVAAMRGFHGRTVGALSLTWEKTYRDPVAPLLIPTVTHVPYNNIERLAEALNESTAAVILEVVQGEGGVHPAEDGYLRAVADLCRANGALLILDEVQTGFGRTGWLFAHQQDGVQPDLLCVAKSMAGGVPMGAVLMGERIEPLPPASHGSTFGGNPLACAAASAVLEVLQSGDLIARARSRGAAVLDHLRTHLPDSTVREVRGRGLMIGVELRGKVAPILKELQSRSVLALPAGRTVLRLLPPLVISDDDLWQAVYTVEEILSHAS